MILYIYRVLNDFDKQITIDVVEISEILCYVLLRMHIKITALNSTLCTEISF